MTLVKVCGVTRLADALAAAEAGANLIGFVFASSPRRADPATVRSISARLASEWPRVGRVGVFVDPIPEEVERIAGEALLTHVQIHGAPPSPPSVTLPWIAALSLGSPDDATRAGDAAPTSWSLLVDARSPGLRGGTGEPFPWKWAAPIVARRRVIVAGGLDAERVGVLLKDLAPFGVDASSRLEREPGIKDTEKVRAFIQAVRRIEGKGP